MCTFRAMTSASQLLRVFPKSDRNGIAMAASVFFSEFATCVFNISLTMIDLIKRMDKKNSRFTLATNISRLCPRIELSWFLLRYKNKL